MCAVEISPHVLNYCVPSALPQVTHIRFGLHPSSVSLRWIWMSWDIPWSLFCSWRMSWKDNNTSSLQHDSPEEKPASLASFLHLLRVFWELHNFVFIITVMSSQLLVQYRKLMCLFFSEKTSHFSNTPLWGVHPAFFLHIFISLFITVDVIILTLLWVSVIKSLSYTKQTVFQGIDQPGPTKCFHVLLRFNNLLANVIEKETSGDVA